MKKLLVLVLLLFSFYYSDSQTIPIRINEYGFIFVDVTLNNSIKAKFLFDTGGGVFIVSGKIYRQIENTVKSTGHLTGFRHDGERMDFEMMLFPSVTIGDYTAANVYGGVYPPFDEAEIDGVIPIKFFENQPVTVNFKDKTLTIETKEGLKEIENSAEQLPLILNTHLDYGLDIFVTVCLNDSIKIKAEFDTGSGFDALVINPFYIPRTLRDTSALKSREYVTPLTGRKLTDRTGKINSVSYCGSTMLSTNDVSITFREGLIYEGLIGSGMFKDRILTIDIPNKRFLVRN